MQGKVTLAYCCINNHLQETLGVTSNRTMRKATFEEKGMNHASSLSLQNVNDLYKIIIWNNKNNIKSFRVTSELFPWASEYEIEDLRDFDHIKCTLEKIGQFVTQNDIRLTMHPGPFNCLTSSDPKIIKNCVKDLSIHGKIFDLMQVSRTPYNLINIHIGGAYKDRERSIMTWVENFHLLPDSVKSRITIENDDRENLYSTKMIYDNIHKNLNIPIVFDSLHHKCGPQDSSYEEAFLMAYETWKNGIVPLMHHSNSRKQWEDPTTKSFTSHSDYYYEPFENFGFDVYLDLECKMKEQAMFKYMKDFCK